MLVACAVVSCGAPFTKRQLAEFVAAAEPYLQQQLGRGLPEGLRVEWTSADFGEDVGRYKHEESLVLISSENLVLSWEAVGSRGHSIDDYARLVVLHELVHAVDAHTPGVRWPSQGESWETESMRALLAVVEGHAHLICLRAAAAQGLEREAVAWFAESFDSLESRDQYWGGAAFLEAVERARGRAGIDQVLRDPPRTYRLIRDPEHYIRSTQ